MIYVNARTKYKLHVYLNHIQLASNESFWKLNEHQETKAKNTIKENVHDSQDSRSAQKYQRRKIHVSQLGKQSQQRLIHDVITQSLLSGHC